MMTKHAIKIKIFVKDGKEEFIIAIWAFPYFGNFLLFFAKASNAAICKKTDIKLHEDAIIKASFKPISQPKLIFKKPNVKTIEPNEPSKRINDIL